MNAHKGLSSALAAVLMMVGLTTTPMTPASAGSGLSLTKEGPERSLLGETVHYELTARNSSGAAQYNLSFSDILPPELEFAGNVLPSGAGKPQIGTSGGQQVLKWLNVTDLQPGSDFTLSFDATYRLPIDATLAPVMTNRANAATSDDARDVPSFNPDGSVNSASHQAPATVNSTKIGVRIIKEEPSPEGELLRGVHDHRTVYTLTVTNNKVAPTDNVIVSDYIPAGMEFLGCANEDNTTNQTPEYPVPATGSSPPDAPPLGLPGVTVDPCPKPIAVDTVKDPTGITGIGDLSGVFTAVTWNLGELQPNETITIRYAAGIPLKENTTTWPNGKPAADTGKQGSNLDNNDGPSTRETLAEQNLDNIAVVTGTFKGSTDVNTVDTDTESVTIEDLRILKSVTPSVFTPGGIAHFRFKVDTSEYMTANQLTVKDLLPDGYCPLGDQNYSDGDTGCDPVPGLRPTINGSDVSYANVNWASPNYEVTFPALPAMNSNDTVTLTLPARMLGKYRATKQPTVAGDSFKNTVELDGTTTPIPANNLETGPQPVKDKSEAVQTTVLPTIDKKMKPRYVPVDCRNLTDQPYREYDDMTETERTFRKGDTVCYKLRIDFPDTATKKPVMSDFVPPGTVYQSGSMWLTPNNTVPAGQINFDDSGNPLVWTLGADDGGALFVAPKLVFEAVIAVTVTDPPVGAAPDIEGNLMKMRTENTLGEGESYRDVVDFDVAPAPNLAISKGVRETTDPVASYNPPGDNKPVQEGSKATFQVDVKNNPRPQFPGTEFSARGVQVWDVLPTELPTIDCSSVSNYRYIAPGANTVVPLNQYVTCEPTTVSGSATKLPTIKWTFPSPDLSNEYSIFTGQTLSLLYDVQIPPKASVSVKWNNTAYVRQFSAFTNVLNVVADYFPKNNVDPNVDPSTWDAVELKDPSSIFIRNAVGGKTGTTSVDQTNNNIPKQATIGETVQYEYHVTIPAGSTVYNGRLFDTLPTGIEFVSADEWGLEGGSQPSGFTFNADGSLDFPAEYDNTTNADQVIYVKTTAKVTKAAADCATDVAPDFICEVPPATLNDLPKQNVAKFQSTLGPTGSTLTRQASYTINIMQPSPAVTKTANPEQVKYGQPITYTLRATNPSGRSPLNEPQAIDCIPPQIENVQLGTPPPLPATATIVADTSPVFPCKKPDYATAIVWSLKTLEPSIAQTLTYTAQLKPGSKPNQLYTNTVRLTGTSMPGAVDGERTYAAGADASILTPQGQITKSVSPSRATIGDTVTNTVELQLDPGNYDLLSVVDSLPSYISASTVSAASVTCEVTDDTWTTVTGPCSSTPNITALTPVTSPLDQQKVGWTFGALPNSDDHVILKITYTSKVTNDSNNKAGDLKTNTATAPYGRATAPTTIAEAMDSPQNLGTATDSFRVIEPDVKIAKTVEDQDSIRVTPDQAFEYKVTVTNPNRPGNYGSTAHNVRVVDTVPQGVTPSDISDNGQLSGNTITWNLDFLDVDGTYTFTYRGRLSPNATTSTKTNVAKVTQYFSLPVNPDSPDPAIRKYSGPQADADVTPVLPAVEIAKFASAQQAFIGQPYLWQIVISNPSTEVLQPGATAFDVDVADTLPPNWEYVPGSSVILLDSKPVSKEPSVSGQSLTWTNIGDLEADTIAVITFEAKPTAAVVTTPGVGLGIPHVNTANTSWKPGPNWTPVSSPDVTAETAIAKADLQLLKSHRTDYEPAINPNEVIPGTEFEWVIDVNNNGPDPSSATFTVEDALQTGTTYKGYSGTGWTCTNAAQLVTCTNDFEPNRSLDKGEELPTLYLKVAVDPAFLGKIDNSATVSGPTYDNNLVNNTHTDTVFARAQADLSLQKSSSGSYVVGNQVVYTLAATNLGPSAAGAPVTVTDTLPTGLSVAGIDAGPWSCSPASGQTTTITCVLNQSIAPNTQAPLIKLTMDVLESPGESAKNCAVADSPTEDTNPENNQSCVTDPVNANVKLGIAKKTTGANPVPAGGSTEFTVTVSNFGPATAKNVKVIDVLEPGLVATSAVGKDWTCDVGSGTIVTCTRRNFAVKDSTSDIVITARTLSSLPAGTTAKNTATVTTGSPQPGGDPPPVTSHVEVIGSSDLAISKTHRKQPWTIGKQGQWYLTVTNNGPSDNPGPIIVTDNLPRGTEYVSATGSGWACEGAARFFTCTSASSMPAGGSAAEISVLVNVVEGAHPSVLNTATVTSPTPDPMTGNNTGTDEVPVERGKQTVPPLPPRLVKGGKTDQGQRIHTRIRCLPLQSSAAGEVSYCKVKLTKNDVYKIRVVGNRPMRVIVTQFAKGTKNYKPWKRVKRFIQRP